MWPLVPLSKIGSLGERRASVVEKMSRARLGHPDYGGTSHKEGEEIWSSDGLGPVSATPVLGLGRGRVPCRIDPTGMRILFSEGHMGNPLANKIRHLGSGQKQLCASAEAEAWAPGRLQVHPLLPVSGRIP